VSEESNEFYTPEEIKAEEKRIEQLESLRLKLQKEEAKLEGLAGQQPVNDGGPAFPVVAENGLGHISDGMTLRDYLAAHAPEEIPYWFESKRNEIVVPQFPQYNTLPDVDKNDGYSYAENDVPLPENASEALKEYAKKVEAYNLARVAHKKREEELVVEHYFAWRYYYADQMLKAREGGAS
jgi:hypothetical protein